jgi:alanine dehydrogenase
MLSDLKQGTVLVDVAIDQGGCFETSRPTTHQVPTYTEQGIIHYCVANIPGAVARTSTFALTNATLPYIVQLANEGLKKAFANDDGLKRGLNIDQGKVTHPAVFEAHGYTE